MNEDYETDFDLRYENFDSINFGIITMGLRDLPFFKDDLWLGMQAMNVGIADSVITEHEYALRQEYFEIEKTPLESAMAVSALSQMWIYGLYEVLRMWRDRRFQLGQLHANGGIDLKIANLPNDDPLNLTIEVRKTQLERYKNESSYRELIESTWTQIEPIYRMTELFRINLAKHCAPGKDNIIPRAPGYGRINRMCGAMDYELISNDGFYQYMNRRDIADALRSCLTKV